MISFFLTIIVAFVLFIGLILKLCNVKMGKSVNRIVCIVLPLICISMFIAMLFESSLKRKAQLRELDSMLTIVENVINCNRVFESNEEKYKCLDSLEWQEQLLVEIAFEDSLVSIITSHDTLIENRIKMVDNVIKQQTKRIKRLNDFYNQEVHIDTSVLDLESVQLIVPVTDKLPTWNFAFNCKRNIDNIICTYVQVLSNDSVVYQNAFEIKEKINSFVAPHIPTSNESIRVGYIIKKDNINEFRYNTYACNY